VAIKFLRTKREKFFFAPPPKKNEGRRPKKKTHSSLSGFKIFLVKGKKCINIMFQ